MSETEQSKETAHLTREALYRAVWETPMSQLAVQYGITGTGLAKICKRLQIPVPSRGYWAKKAAGKKVITYRLPEPTKSLPQRITITPTPPPPPAPVIAPELQAKVDAALANVSAVPVPERLTRPHTIIAAWLDDHEQRKREAQRSRDPWLRNISMPKPFTATDGRRHRILDALFKALEREGAKIVEDERRQLLAEIGGERIEFQLREKSKQVRRALSKDEKRWQKRDWAQELQPTGKLLFVIKTYLPAGLGLRQEWLETERAAMEDLLTDILAAFIKSAPLLAQQRRRREEEARERQVAEQRRYEEEQRRKLERNQWRRFMQFADEWRDASVAREFLNALQSADIDQNLVVAGRSLGAWISWATAYLAEADPLIRGPEHIFAEVAKITSWTYRD
jgi:hypothetical protein